MLCLARVTLPPPGAPQHLAVHLWIRCLILNLRARSPSPPRGGLARQYEFWARAHVVLLRWPKPLQAAPTEPELPISLRAVSPREVLHSGDVVYCAGGTRKTGLASNRRFRCGYMCAPATLRKACPYTGVPP